MGVLLETDRDAGAEPEQLVALAQGVQQRAAGRVGKGFENCVVHAVLYVTNYSRDKMVTYKFAGLRLLRGCPMIV